MDLKVHMTLIYLKIRVRILLMASHVYKGLRINDGYWAVFGKEITGYFDCSVSTQTRQARQNLQRRLTIQKQPFRFF